MHPDLQRRLVRLLKRRPGQVILTTHSPEIMAEVDPEQILVVDRNKRHSSFATTLPAAQAVLDSLGSVQNLQLTRLWKTRKLLLVEGKDIQLLKVFQNKLFPDSIEPIDAVPGMQIGGWSGWPTAIGSALTMHNAADETIRVYCLMDSDYHTPPAIGERLRQATERGVDLHVWTKKEIENYLVVPSAVARLIRKRSEGAQAPSEQEIETEIRRVSQELRDRAFDALAAEVLAEDRALGLPGANQRARQIRDARLAAGSAEVDLVSGKEILSQLSTWSQARFGVSFGAISLAKEIQSSELDAEIRRVIEAIEVGMPFQ